MNQPTSFKTALVESLAAAMNHATPILARLRNVFGQQRLPAVSATAHDAHEPRHESSSLERNSLVLEITGMTCAGCASHVEKALLSAPGVHKADVSYAEGTARVSGEGAFDPAALSAAVHAAGYGVGLEKSAHAGGLPENERSRLERNSLVLEITGMTCAGWASPVETALLSGPCVQ